MEFRVGSLRTSNYAWEKMFHTWRDACAHAVSIASSGRDDVVIDVLLYSKEDAWAWGGDDAVEKHREDPDASVHQRIHVRAEDLGRVR